MAPGKGSVIKPAGKTRSAAEFVTLLRGRPSRNDLTQLADHLDPSKPMHVSGFLASFIEAQVRSYRCFRLCLDMACNLLSCYVNFIDLLQNSLRHYLRA